MQSGDRAAGERYARRALPDMERLGADEDVTQLRALLAFVAIETGRLDEAEREFERIAADGVGQSMLGGFMVLPCGVAELALARGDVERGLDAYREAAETMRRASFPGLEMNSGFEPWVLYPEAGAVAAHARHRPLSGTGRRMHRHLAGKAVALLGRDSGFLDYPAAGAVAFALGLWDLRQPDAPVAVLERAVRLLALADRFAYSRMLPALSWPLARDVAEERCPGLLDAVQAELAPRTVVDLREDVLRLVSDIG